jgi:hypothetical protein
MLNWARPKNVQRIVARWRETTAIDEYIVLSNSGTMPELPDYVTQVTSSVDLGLRSRFLAVLMARNEGVLIQDDDLLVPPRTVEALYAHWKQEPSVLHGLFGRQPEEDGTYAISHNRERIDCDMILTRCLVAPAEYAVRFFEHERYFEILDAGEPPGNGEDIVFSYIARAYSGKSNRCYPYAAKELRARQAIHRRVSDHKAHRTRVLETCLRWLAEHPESATAGPAAE